MKLNEQQAGQIKTETGLDPIPTEVATESGLTQHFGENTFYLNADGIYVFEERAQEAPDSASEATAVTAVKIAAVEQSGQNGEVMVRGVQPEETTLTVALS